ncbi:hypothetical protein [Mesorhizobium sp. M00.F.Ca.ET.216.01.1.1]|uniref:hypothetical protein n=1 Tax=Mesorhizobium sp. M00.F.Ca.ET.216.01.1.1 TaxID=2500528 RepID=UPI001672F515|nr:hypothetical protein [Mesorhizobium sp. M00.F.Ca.ET.216.01.1.1]
MQKHLTHFAAAGRRPEPPALPGVAETPTDAERCPWASSMTELAAATLAADKVLVF